jgi:hypothetical protein
MLLDLLQSIKITLYAALFIALLPAAARSATLSNAISTQIAAASASDIISKARQLNQNGNNIQADYLWIANYDIKFTGCYTGSTYQSGQGFRSTLLAKFQLCPSGSSSKCKNGGDYVVSMQDFVETYHEAKMSAQQYQCMNMYEICKFYCNGSGYYDNCISSCFTKAGADYSYCSNYYPYGNNNNKNNRNDDFEVWRFVECSSINGGGDNNRNQDNNRNNKGYDSNGNPYYYVGAYCAKNGAEVRLGVFSDWKCASPVSVSTYETLTGYTLPFTSSSIIGTNPLQCKGQNNNGQDQALEVCQKVYQSSAKCETNLQIDNKDTSACPYVTKGVVQVSKAMAGDFDGTPNTIARTVVPTVFATLLAITTFLSCGYNYYLRHLLIRRLINTSDKGLASKIVGEAA